MVIDHDKEHECPVYGKVINPDLCYDSAICLMGLVKVEALAELRPIKDIENARKICRECPYCDMS